MLFTISKLEFLYAPVVRWLICVQLPPHPTVDALTRFHSDDFIYFLRSTADLGANLYQSSHSGADGASPDFKYSTSPPHHAGATGPPYSHTQGGPVSLASSPQAALSSHGFNSGPTKVSVYGGSSSNGSLRDQMSRFNLGEDCPVFDGLWEYCKTYTGGSIEGARRVASGEYLFAINW